MSRSFHRRENWLQPRIAEARALLDRSAMSPRLRVAVESYGAARGKASHGHRAFAAKLLTDVVYLDMQKGWAAPTVIVEAMHRLTTWSVPSLLERTRTCAELCFAVLREDDAAKAAEGETRP